MPRFAALLALLLATLGLAACGGEDDVAPGGPDAVARAASATAQAGTAATRLTVEARGFGLRKPVAVTGSGVTSLDSAELDLTFDLDPVVEALTARAPEAALLGDGLKLRMLVQGSQLRVQLPQVAALAVPGGARWIGLDTRKAVKALDDDAQVLASAFRVDPAGQLDALRAAGAVEDVGTTELDGEQVRRYAGTLTLEESLAAVPEADRAAVRKALQDLTAGSGAEDVEVPFEAWVDGDGMIRREQLTIEGPTRDGKPAGTVVVRVEYSDFGRELDVRLPPARETYDATGLLVGLLEQGAAARSLPTP